MIMKQVWTILNKLFLSLYTYVVENYWKNSPVESSFAQFLNNYINNELRNCESIFNRIVAMQMENFRIISILIYF